MWRFRGRQRCASSGTQKRGSSGTQRAAPRRTAPRRAPIAAHGALPARIEGGHDVRHPSPASAARPTSPWRRAGRRSPSAAEFSSPAPSCCCPTPPWLLWRLRLAVGKALATGESRGSRWKRSGGGCRAWGLQRALHWAGIESKDQECGQGPGVTGGRAAEAPAELRAAASSGRPRCSLQRLGRAHVCQPAPAPPMPQHQAASHACVYIKVSGERFEYNCEQQRGWACRITLYRITRGGGGRQPARLRKS